MISPFFQPERIEKELSSIAFYHIVKRMINRGLDDDSVTGLCYALNGKIECRNHSRTELKAFALQFPVMPILSPAGKRLPVELRHQRIAKTVVLYSFHQGILYGRWRKKLHIGYPKGQDFVASEYLAAHIPLHTVGSAAICDFIKRAFHGERILLAKVPEKPLTQKKFK
jgi:hypothetical protein